MYDTLIECPCNPVRQRHCMYLSVTVILWHRADACHEFEIGAEHSFSRLQPSINLHAQLQPLCSAVLVPNGPPHGMKARVSPVQ